MTVRDLINLLNRFPPDLPILLRDGDRCIEIESAMMNLRHKRTNTPWGVIEAPLEEFEDTVMLNEREDN